MGMFEWVDPTRNAFVRILRDAPISKLADEGLPSQNKLREALLAMPKFDRNAKIEDESAFWNPGGMFGTFAGVNAKTANKAMLEVAQKMDKAGADRGAIWNETGWFKGPEGRWKFEIPDNNLAVPEGQMVPEYRTNLTRGNGPFRHPELLDAYPNMATTPATFYAGYGKNLGEYDNISDSIKVWMARHPEARSTAAHELQHAIQSREGFHGGGMIPIPNEVTGAFPSREAALRHLETIGARGQIEPVLKTRGDGHQFWLLQGKIEKGRGGYERSAGEAEARAVQERLHMTPAERKAKAPWESYDIPWDQLIIR